MGARRGAGAAQGYFQCAILAHNPPPRFNCQPAIAAPKTLLAPEQPSARLAHSFRGLIAAPPKSLRRTPVSAICHACKLDSSFLPRRSHAKAAQLSEFQLFRLARL